MCLLSQTNRPDQRPSSNLFPVSHSPPFIFWFSCWLCILNHSLPYQPACPHKLTDCGRQQETYQIIPGLQVAYKHLIILACCRQPSKKNASRRMDNYKNCQYTDKLCTDTTVNLTLFQCPVFPNDNAKSGSLFREPLRPCV
jgi:hypothetical protein